MSVLCVPSAEWVAANTLNGWGLAPGAKSGVAWP